MHKNKIILTWEAIYDITNIAIYIESTFGLERANQFQNDMQKQLSTLKILGSAYQKTQFYHRDYHIYKKPFSPSVIFYIIKESKKEVHILRVLREECNWEKIFIEQQEYTYPNELSDNDIQENDK